MTKLKRFFPLPLIILLTLASHQVNAASDPLRENLFQFLQKDDLLIIQSGDYRNLASAMALASASKRGDWKNPVFFSEQSYNYLLFAYRHKFINRFEFTDIQDYLHILTDFKTSTTSQFDRIPVRIPAFSIERVRMDQLHATPYEAMISESTLSKTAYPEKSFRRPVPQTPDYWATIVKVDPDLLSKAKSDFSSFD